MTKPKVKNGKKGVKRTPDLAKAKAHESPSKQDNEMHLKVVTESEEKMITRNAAKADDGKGRKKESSASGGYTQRLQGGLSNDDQGALHEVAPTS